MEPSLLPIPRSPSCFDRESQRKIIAYVKSGCFSELVDIAQKEQMLLNVCYELWRLDNTGYYLRKYLKTAIDERDFVLDCFEIIRVIRDMIDLRLCEHEILCFVSDFIKAYEMSRSGYSEEEKFEEYATYVSNLLYEMSLLIEEETPVATNRFQEVSFSRN